jgi:hypothetical protein
MSEALHCDCGVERDGSHETDCLVGAVHGVARALRLLGNHDAATSMGAIEALGLTITNAAVTVAAGLGEIADAASGED